MLPLIGIFVLIGAIIIGLAGSLFVDDITDIQKYRWWHWLVLAVVIMTAVSLFLDIGSAIMKLWS